MTGVLSALGAGSRTALGFFWKSGWAFVLGYSISAMIQAFVPKARLTRDMGDAGPGSSSMAWLHHRDEVASTGDGSGDGGHDHGGGDLSPKRAAAWLAIGVLAVGATVWLVPGLG